MFNPIGTCCVALGSGNKYQAKAHRPIKSIASNHYESGQTRGGRFLSR